MSFKKQSLVVTSNVGQTQRPITEKNLGIGVPTPIPGKNLTCQGKPHQCKLLISY